MVDPSAPARKFLETNFEEIPKSAWGSPGLLPPDTGVQGRLSFPQGEHPARIYEHAAGNVPSQLSLKDTTLANLSWPPYAQVPPQDHYDVRLGLPATGPRSFRFVYLDLTGRDLEIRVQGRLLKSVRAGASGGQWIPAEVALPAGLPDNVLFEIWNPGRFISAVSSVQLYYGSRER